MPATLRGRLGLGAALAFAVGLISHVLAAYIANSHLGGPISSQHITRRQILFDFFAVFGGIAIALGVTLFAGVVASLVIEEGLKRRIAMAAELEYVKGANNVAPESD